MKQVSSNRRSEPSDFLLIRPAAALMSLGMVLPEYLVVLALSALLPMMVLAIIQAISRRDDRRDAKPHPALPRLA